MATKLEVIAGQYANEYTQYIMIASIQVARDVVAESSGIAFHAQRLVFARQILQDPMSRVNVFKSLVIANLNTSTYESLTEDQKVSGAKTLVAAVFNEAGYIF